MARGRRRAFFKKNIFFTVHFCNKKIKQADGKRGGGGPFQQKTKTIHLFNYKVFISFIPSLNSRDSRGFDSSKCS